MKLIFHANCCIILPSLNVVEVDFLCAEFMVQTELAISALTVINSSYTLFRFHFSSVTALFLLMEENICCLCQMKIISEL